MKSPDGIASSHDNGTSLSAPRFRHSFSFVFEVNGYDGKDKMSLGPFLSFSTFMTTETWRAHRGNQSSLSSTLSHSAIVSAVVFYFFIIIIISSQILVQYLFGNYYYYSALSFTWNTWLIKVNCSWTRLEFSWWVYYAVNKTIIALLLFGSFVNKHI